MSRAKSIWFVAGGGSFDSSISAAKTEEPMTKPARKLELSVERRVIGNLEPLFEGANFGKSNGSFPLTPALSPEERENRSPVLRQSAASLCSESGIRCLPLPKGEGRGEGEGEVRQHDGLAIGSPAALLRAGLRTELLEVIFLRITSYELRITFHASIQHPRIDVGTMHGRMAARAPTTAQPQVVRMIDLADKKTLRAGGRALDLGVTFQAQIIVPLDQHFGVDRTVRGVANRTAFSQRFVFVDYRPALFPMALRATFIQASHGQAARGFHDVHAVRVMAMHAIQFAFDHRVMLRQVELRVDFQMTREARRGIASRIDNEFAAPAARSDVFAPSAMARFTAAAASELRVRHVNARMRAGGKNANDIRVTVVTNFVSDKGGSRNFRWRHQRPLHSRARHQNDAYCTQCSRRGNEAEPDFRLRIRLVTLAATTQKLH